MGEDSLYRKVKLTNEDAKIAMSAKPTEKYNRLVKNVISEKRKQSRVIPSWMRANKSVLAQAMKRRSKKNGIDYEKLYFGTDEEKRKEKLIQKNNYKKQSLESWTEDDSI